MKVSLEGLDVSKLLPTDMASYTLSQIGLAQNYVFGMYGYCRDNDGWNCPATSTSYKFNLVDFLVDQISSNNSAGLTVTASDITLPKDLDTYISVSNSVSQIIYITSIIACCLQFVTIVAEWVMWRICGRLLISILELLVVIAALLTSGAATGLYAVYVSGLNYEDFGVDAKLSVNYLALTWVGTFATMVTFALTLLNCCCGGRSRRSEPEDYEKRVIA